MLKDNQEEIFVQWLGKYKKLIFKIVKAHEDSPQDQDDLFQEILLQIWSSIPNFEHKARETTWIYRVALNTAMLWKRGQVRKRKRHRRSMVDFSSVSHTDESHANSICRPQIMDQLYGAIHKLPKIDGSIILMYLDGLSYDKMAEILGISKSNLGVRLNRAKKQLAQLLKGLIDDF